MCREGQNLSCIEKLDKYIHKIKTVSYELQNYVFDDSAKKEIFDIYTDQRFRIIERSKEFLDIRARSSLTFRRL